jgi:hypothetical protein
VLGERLPERFAFAQAAHAAAGKRDFVGAQRKSVARLQRLRHRGERHARRRIAVDKIENAVPAGIPAGDETRPRHGALRRNAGG